MKTDSQALAWAPLDNQIKQIKLNCITRVIGPTVYSYAQITYLKVISTRLFESRSLLFQKAVKVNNIFSFLAFETSQQETLAVDVPASIPDISVGVPCVRPPVCAIRSRERDEVPLNAGLGTPYLPRTLTLFLKMLC
jgi:hypothetical protein